MATHTVKQSGGDFSTLASAAADSGTGTGDTISIEGTWTVSDTSAVVISDTNIAIVADSDSKHPGYVNLASNHYRLEVSGGHVITAGSGAGGLSFDGIVLKQDGTGASDEIVRYDNSGSLTFIDCVLWADSQDSDQDAIYADTSGGTINFTNTCIYGFHRAGVYLHTTGITINLNSCTFWDMGYDTDVDDSGAIGNDYSGGQVNIFNCAFLDCHNHANASDLNGDHGAWDIHNSIDSDGSIASQDSGAVGCLASRSPTDSSSPGLGDWVIFEDITSLPYDLRLQDESTNNDAQEMHTTSSGAGMSMPSTDIMGNTRSSPYDCGAFHVVSGGPAFRPKHSPLHGPFSGPFGGPL